MKKIFLLHGFNVHDGGRNTIDRMRPYFEKQHFYVKDIDYGWMGLVGVRWCNRHLARVLAHLLDPECILVGHSNGCAIAALTCDFGYKADGLVFIQPALNRSWVPPAQVTWMHVYANKKDLPIWLSTFLINHIWGDMGRVGPSYKDDRVETTFLGFGGHNAEFKSPAIMEWIAEDIKQKFLINSNKILSERYKL